MKTTSAPLGHPRSRGPDPIPPVMPNGHLPNRWSLACLCVVLATALLPSAAWAQNHPPVAETGPDKNAYLADWVTVNGSATDPDGYSAFARRR